MAKKIEFLSGSPLIGSPLVFNVTPSTHKSIYNFHRTQLMVYARLIIPGGDSDEDDQEFKFSTAVDATTTVAQFDISSALRAVADRYVYDVAPPSQYPYVKFRLEAADDWMIDGRLYENQGRVYHPGSMQGDQGTLYFYYYAFLGRFTDLERLQATGEDTQQLSVMTCKPASGVEVVHQNTTMVYPVDFSRGLECDYMSDDPDPEFVSNAPQNGPRSDQFTPQATGAMVVGGRNIYVIPKPADAAELRFISSKGCMESLHLQCLPKRVVNIQTDKYVISRQETFKKFSRATTRKHNDYETWTLSSGPLDEAWAEFYIHEVLMAQVMWLHRGQMWLPCHVLPEETTQLRDKSKPELIEVQLTVQMDVDGAM